MILYNLKFTELVANGKISPSLKSFADTNLFFYVGYLACKNSGDLCEIGVGGSSYVLQELSEVTNRILYLVDMEKKYLDIRSNTEYFPTSICKPICSNSAELHKICPDLLLVYCHIDGDKSYKNTRSDLEYAVTHLSEFGIICQDDYGNNKWPEVNEAVFDLVHEGLLSIIVVGDSSIWLTKPKWKSYWMNLLTTDQDFQKISSLFHVVKTVRNNPDSTYYYMNSAMVSYASKVSTAINENDLTQMKKLISYDTSYLKMPYPMQSQPGTCLQLNTRYLIIDQWYAFRSDRWPINPPSNKEEILNLPEFIKKEMHKIHGIDNLLTEISLL